MVGPGRRYTGRRPFRCSDLGAVHLAAGAPPAVEVLALPTYEYACRSCDTHLEVVQRFDDEPLAECPACGGQLRKVFGSIGISFKGSGFYKNDSRSVSKAGSGTSPKATGGDGDSSSGSSDASTPASTDTGSGGAKESKGADASTTSTKTTTAAPSSAPPAKSA